MPAMRRWNRSRISVLSVLRSPVGSSYGPACGTYGTTYGSALCGSVFTGKNRAPV